jgi:periplasmic divalent cation tolerance protein
MQREEGYCILLNTCPGDEAAEKLAESIINSRLAACVQIMPIRSFYEWNGEIHRDEERLLIMKTTVSCYKQLEEFIVKHHPYEIPEIAQVPIESGLQRYFDWIDRVTG